MRRSLERVLARIETTGLNRDGLEKKRFGNGRDYVTTLTALGDARSHGAGFGP